ncbi:hypothetical protein L3Q82_003821 [Scortum barcoo]|uniref:Uncharacterized protein n=1 Tax=Scortum barcoo TaxID=214431 RepID=A0ACB8X6B9_9TELE|nr:hypothetical protein L3Q82_003821 [Scortum barcoo]
MTIHSVSKSDEGLYKCRISDVGESAESRLEVRDPVEKSKNGSQIDSGNGGMSSGAIFGIVFGCVAVLIAVVVFTLWKCGVIGEPQVIGSLGPIIAAPGDVVILPCHLEPHFNVEGLTVEWSKPDLKPNLSDRLSRIIHLYRNRREDPDMKLRSYFGRTLLFTDELKRGNISLKIMNVTLADEGRYKCLIPKLKSTVKESIVKLVVDPNYVKTVTTETPLHPRNLQTPNPNDETNVEVTSRDQIIQSVSISAVVLLVVLILAGVGVGYLLKHKSSKTDVFFMLVSSLLGWTLCVCAMLWTPVGGEPQVIGSLGPIIAAPGDDVILPCHLEPHFNVEGLTVEWSKPDLKPDPSDRLSRVDYVHLYRNRREDPDMKLRSYFGRTSLFTDELKRGNISLKIMNVTLADEGRYKCLIPKLKSTVKESIVQLVVDPNYVKTVTTETPPPFQTPKDETNVEVTSGDRSIWITAVVLFVVLWVMIELDIY